MNYPLFDFSKDYVLENERVKLNPLLEEHYETLANIAQSEQIWTYFLEKGFGKTTSLSNA